MQRLTISNLGPISELSMDIKDIIVLTGPQASGKSTVAKSVFFFNNLKNTLFFLCQRQIAAGPAVDLGDLRTLFSHKIRNEFVRSFGSYNDTIRNGYVLYEYDNACSIMVSYGASVEIKGIAVTLNNQMQRKLDQLLDYIMVDERRNVDEVRQFINDEVFASDMDVVYIPAGRSMLTSLSSQISYFYSVMDDRTKSMIDFCTQVFLEKVLILKEYFTKDFDSILKHTIETAEYDVDEDRARLALNLIREILGGEYRVVNGEERLYYEGQEYVKINYASSGQQEAVWIVNILFYYMLGERKTYFIIEEPESHLFPETQKAVTELICLVKNGSNGVIVTTHSPYVLGSFNNLLCANHMAKESNAKDIETLIPRQLWVDYDSLGAYYLEAGELKSISNDEYQDMDHEVIDGVSGVINKVYEKLLEVSERS